MVLIWWGRTVYTFPITTYGEFSKGSTSVNTVCSTSSQWNKQNPPFLAGTGYFMRWRARLLSHATSEFFCLAVNPVVSEPALSRDCNSNVPLRLWRNDLRVWRRETEMVFIPSLKPAGLCEKHKAWQSLFQRKSFSPLTFPLSPTVFHWKKWVTDCSGMKSWDSLIGWKIYSLASSFVRHSSAFSLMLM